MGIKNIHYECNWSSLDAYGIRHKHEPYRPHCAKVSTTYSAREMLEIMASDPRLKSSMLGGLPNLLDIPRIDLNQHKDAIFKHFSLYLLRKNTDSFLRKSGIRDPYMVALAEYADTLDPDNETDESKLKTCKESVRIRQGENGLYLTDAFIEVQIIRGLLGIRNGHAREAKKLRAHSSEVLFYSSKYKDSISRQSRE